MVYYTGIKYRKPPEGAKKNGAICLAVLRRDGFVSMDVGDTGGTLLTQVFRLTGTALTVNVDATGGELRAEIVSRDNQVLAASEPVSGDQPRARLRWRKGDESKFTGRDIRLRFSLRNASLYSYWIE